jgi:hypothetical protein
VNTTLPPSRDLPPGRHNEIRHELLTAVAPRQTRRWLAPLVTAAAALVVVGMVAWFAPWNQSGGTAGGQPAATTTQPAPPSTGANGHEGDAPAIVEGCVQSAGVKGEFTLRQLITDGAGRYALLYSDKNVLGCTLDVPTMPYNAGFSSLTEFVAPVSVDYTAAAAGGDVSGNKSQYAGQHGTIAVMGRIAPEVAKVTVTLGTETLEAAVSEGTYVVRGVYPTTWEIPDNLRAVVRAYDKNGTLLDEISQ